MSLTLQLFRFGVASFLLKNPAWVYWPLRFCALRFHV